MEFEMSTFVSLTYKASGLIGNQDEYSNSHDKKREKLKWKWNGKTANDFTTWLNQLEEGPIDYWGCYIYLKKQTSIWFFQFFMLTLNHQINVFTQSKYFSLWDWYLLEVKLWDVIMIKRFDLLHTFVRIPNPNDQKQWIHFYFSSIFYSFFPFFWVYICLIHLNSPNLFAHTQSYAFACTAQQCNYINST